MHGIQRTPTWTELETTVEAGGTVIVLKEDVDWVAGEMIAIASTSYEPREGEHRTILSIDADMRTITLDQPLDYKHFAEYQTFGDDGDFIEMRAEVGLLSRNVVYRGDPETSPGN
jgi:predicted phage tail protein